MKMRRMFPLAYISRRPLYETLLYNLTLLLQLIW